ncbi:MAG: hypothetical protein HOP28_01855 [Gemmatimonadales bacterium]|nr:hypothetical protein [Gemmatimonadales bacterium]
MRPVSIRVCLLTAMVLGGAATAGAQYPESKYPVRAVPGWARQVTWTKLGEDPSGDGRRPAAPDGKALWFYHDVASDTLWFRLEVFGVEDSVSVAASVSFDLDADQSTGLNWYGTNRAFTFDKMISIGLLRREGDWHIGYNGFSTAEGVRRFQYLTEKLGTIAFIVDPVTHAYLVGVARRDLGENIRKVNVIATVGQNAVWNDDLINTGFATLEFKVP